MRVIGHRGVVDFHGPTENTLAAVERALAEGADGVEVDVRLTADGVAVCVHDRDLHRVATRCTEVSRATLAELKRIQLPGGDVVPTLGEVLETVTGRGLLVVDVKPAGARTRWLLDRLRLDLQGRRGADVVVSSSDVTAVYAAGPAIAGCRRALICDPGARLGPALRLARDLDVDVHPHVRSLVADLPALAAAAARGRTLRAWTVNDPGDVRRLADIGVSAVITDAPSVVVATLGPRLALV